MIAHPHIGQAAVNCIRRLALPRVLHEDIRLPDFIVRDGGQVFVLDFRLIMFHEEGVSDEK